MMIPVAAANAGVIVFTLDGGEGETQFTKTVSGVTLTVENPTPSTITALPNFYLTGTTQGFMRGFTFRFDANVQLTGYTIGNNGNGTEGAYFDLTGPNGNAMNNSLQTIGTFSPSSSFFLLAGESGTLASTFTDQGGVRELVSFTVETSEAPEPATWTLLGGALASLVAIRRRGRQAPQIE